MEYLLLIIGFIILIKGAGLFVDGASSLAKTFKVPSILIGLTIVAIGTSAPEAAVSINSTLNNSGDIAVGNIIGSSIFNILLVVGVTSIIKPIKIKAGTIFKEVPFLLLASIVLYIFSSDIKLQGDTVNTLSKGDGFVLLLLFLIFLYYMIEMAVKSKHKFIEEIAATSKEKHIRHIEVTGMVKNIIWGLVGLIGVIKGGDMVVQYSKTIAIHLGMSEVLVGLTIVAIGTSLPELVTSITAALKGESDIAMGNAIGSNVFNILLILGITSVIKPIPISDKIFSDIMLLIGATIVTYIFIISKKKTSKIEGVMLVIAYVMYMAYIIVRN